MSKRVFNLSDFDSRSCDIEIRSAGDSILKLSLRKFNLLDRIWAEQEFSSLSNWEKTLFPSDQNYNEGAWLEALLKTTHRLLEDQHKQTFPEWTDLAAALDSTIQVLAGLQKALLYVLHVSEPLIDEFDKVIKKNLSTIQQPTPNPNRKTRRKSKTGRS